MNVEWGKIDINSRMTCLLDGEDILEYNMSGQTQAIGKSNKWCDELLEIANDYKKLCIEAGLIEEEKTPEQIQMEFMQTMMAEMQKLTKKVEVLENGHHESSGTGGKPAASRPTKSTKSSATSVANSATSED